MYYLFESALQNQISLAMSQKQGGGFFDFKPKQKIKYFTNIPNSNTDSTPVADFRTVYVLETNFAEQDA